MPEDPAAETRFHVNLLKRLLREQAESTGRLAKAKKAPEIFLYYLTCTDWVRRHETLHADILRKAKEIIAYVDDPPSTSDAETVEALQHLRRVAEAEFIGKIRLLGGKLPTSILAFAAILKI